MGNKKTYKFKGIGLHKEEKVWAKKRFKEYQDNYHIDNFSDLQLLEELVYREAIQERYKKQIEQVSNSKKTDTKKVEDTKKSEHYIPKGILSALNANLEQILILKDKLGLFEEKKDKDEYKAFQILEKKFDIWKTNHIEERKVTCPFCSQIFFLNIRTTGFTESKLKLFKNKVLCNSTLWKIYKEKKITKEEFAEILNVSPDYIDFLEKKIYPSK